MDTEFSLIKVSLFGAGGRMGKEVADILQAEEGYELVNLIEHPDHPSVGGKVYDIPVNGDPYNLPLAGTVFCDFTLAEAAVRNCALAAELECPILIGATGFTVEQQRYMEELGNKIPIMIASNLSRGINLLYALIEKAAKVLSEGYEAGVVETHHKWKQDSPSGTAKEMLRIMEDSGFEDVSAHSLRMGDITGEHLIQFSSEGETIQLVHRAHSRKAFARGVIPALKFLNNAKPGLYSFREALNF